MSSNIVPPASFDTTQITFRAPKILDSGGKQVYLDYEGRPLLTQTASMPLPYGLNTFDKAGPTTYSVDLSFRGMETDPKVKHFYDMMVAFDELLIEAGIKNSQAWFKMPNASREVIKAFYTPSVKVSLDKDGKPKPYPPTFKVKLPKKNGTFETSFYDAEKRPYEGVSVEELMVKGARGVFLVKCTGLWFAGSKYGASWKAVQVKLDSVPQSGLGRGCAILDDDDAPVVRRQASGGGRAAAPADEDEDDVVEAVMPSSRAPASAAAAAQEEEDEDEEEDVVEAPPPPRRTAAPAASATGVRKVVKKTAK
jgi:hypothetical protein